MPSLMMLLAVAATLFASSCASTHVNEHPISSFFPSTLRVRRPLGPGADPKAGPGGTDYKSSPLPNEQWDCETLGSFFGNLPKKPIRDCLVSIQNPAEVSYRLAYEPRPKLTLQDPEDAPACLRERMPELPVPRETFFESDDSGDRLCYSSRIDVEADRILGIRVPGRAKFAVSIKFPLAAPVQDDADLMRWLAALVLTPYFKMRDGDRAWSKVVPDNICAQCLGEKAFHEPEKSDRWTWPGP